MTSSIDSEKVQQAYQECLFIATTHYENFPVASWLLPKKLRQPVAAIYAFARQVDDLADEGSNDAVSRLAALEHAEQKLNAVVAGEPVDDPVFIALGDTIRRYDLPVTQLQALLSAFRQDVTKKRYRDFDEVMAYCRLSANPVGRMLLHLEGQDDPDYLAESDAICSALQLINFYQDLHSDYIERGRIYLPLEEMARFDVSEFDIAQKKTTPALRRLMHHQYQRTARLLHKGMPLGKRLRGRLGLELRAIIASGALILVRLERQEEDLFSRPRLNLWDRITILRNACMPFRWE